MRGIRNIHDMVRAALLATLATGLLALVACTPEQQQGLQPLVVVNGGRVMAATAGGDALERVIDQELLAQKARETGLDREPGVQLALEQAQREVLARAHVLRLAAAAASDAGQIKAFYQDHPELFEHRRVYTLQELSVAAGPAQLGSLKARMAHAGGVGELASWLRSQRLEHRLDAVIRPAERLPIEALPRIAAMKPGDMEWFDLPDGVLVVQLVRAMPQPLSESEALPIITRYLEMRRQAETAAVEINRLRGQADIRYAGRPSTVNRPGHDVSAYAPSVGLAHARDQP